MSGKKFLKVTLALDGEQIPLEGFAEVNIRRLKESNGFVINFTCIC